jgi:hypothetical protein
VQDQEDALIEEVRRLVAISISTRQPLDMAIAADRIAERLPDVPRTAIVNALLRAAGPAHVAIRFEGLRKP